MNELVDGVPNAEAAIAYALKRWGYRQGTKECVAFYRGACWLQLASIPPITPVEAGKVGVASGVPVVDKAHERIAFEAWCERRGRGHSTVLKFDNGDYRNETAREEWRGWLGRATHPSGVAPTDCVWPIKPLKQVQVTLPDGMSVMAIPERAYFDAWAMQELENKLKSAAGVPASDPLSGIDCYEWETDGMELGPQGPWVRLADVREHLASGVEGRKP